MTMSSYAHIAACRSGIITHTLAVHAICEAVPGGFAFCGKHMEAISALTALHSSLIREMIASRRATASEAIAKEAA